MTSSRYRVTVTILRPASRTMPRTPSWFNRRSAVEHFCNRLLIPMKSVPNSSATDFAQTTCRDANYKLQSACTTTDDHDARHRYTLVEKTLEHGGGEVRKFYSHSLCSAKRLGECEDRRIYNSSSNQLVVQWHLERILKDKLRSLKAVM